MEKMAAAIAEGFRVHFRDDPEVKIVADPEYHPNRGYFVLRLSNALGNNTGVGDTGYVRMKLEALRDRLSSHPFNFGRWHLEDNGWLVLHCHHEPNPSLARTGGV
ncbi:MAG TPA: hypothetical protein VD998_03510 [Verrucomicrobiae bacterium]|nr:hypothetical protein [Verrucomicrobiae bacterium]